MGASGSLFGGKKKSSAPAPVVATPKTTEQAAPGAADPGKKKPNSGQRSNLRSAPGANTRSGINIPGR